GLDDRLFAAHLVQRVGVLERGRTRRRRRRPRGRCLTLQQEHEDEQQRHDPSAERTDTVSLMSDVASRGYADPSVLVSTEWVAEHLNDPNVRIVESNEDTLLYASGHLPGSVHVDWTHDLNDPVRRDYITRKGFEALMSKIGATPKTTVVFYGDKNNWWACYALWVFQLFGHKNARIMDGGRVKWMKEERPLTKDASTITPTKYKAPERKDAPMRVFQKQVLAHVKGKGQLVDVRSPEEFAGTRMHMPDYP